MLEICHIFLPTASIPILVGVLGTHNKIETMYGIRLGIYDLFLSECKHLNLLQRAMR